MSCELLVFAGYFHPNQLPLLGKNTHSESQNFCVCVFALGLVVGNVTWQMIQLTIQLCGKQLFFYDTCEQGAIYGNKSCAGGATSGLINPNQSEEQALP